MSCNQPRMHGGDKPASRLARRLDDRRRRYPLRLPNQQRLGRLVAAIFGGQQAGFERARIHRQARGAQLAKSWTALRAGASSGRSKEHFGWRHRSWTAATGATGCGVLQPSNTASAAAPTNGMDTLVFMLDPSDTQTIRPPRRGYRLYRRVARLCARREAYGTFFLGSGFSVVKVFQNAILNNAPAAKPEKCAT